MMYPAISTVEFMFMAIWGVNGFHLPDLLPSECRFNAQYFVEHGMAPMVQTVFPQGRTRETHRLNVHFSKVMEQFFIENQLLHVPHLPYSADLALPDSRLLGHVKPELAGRTFAEPEELLEGVREFLEGIPAAELTAVLEGWIDQVRWVIAHNVQYYNS
jgi:hypothetical protein